MIKHKNRKAKMYKNEMISVITPVYNAEEFLKETIDSVLNQTYENLEYILVDDCSSDNSSEIIKHYTETDSNLVEAPISSRTPKPSPVSLIFSYLRARPAFCCLNFSCFKKALAKVAIYWIN